MSSVTVIYGRGALLTGQRLASEIVIEGLRERGWQVRVIATPLLDRTAHGGGRWLQLLAMVGALLWAWARALAALLRGQPLYVSLGQTRVALLRDGFPLLLAALLGRQLRAVAALNGSLFMAWATQSTEARLLRACVRGARSITVVGERQRQALIALGIPGHKVVHVDNTCRVAALAVDACVQKQESAPGEAVHVLFLSNLIESKGWPVFLEALAQLSATPSAPIVAVLCGRLVENDENSRFATLSDAERWLNEQIEAINQSTSVVVRWIPGAFGAEKEALLAAAQIFVLPTAYSVEAQPLVLLEALASGCALITTMVGEIPSTVSPETAVLVEQPTASAVAEAIYDLCSDPARRTALALTGLELFKHRFAYDAHLDRWEALLSFDDC